MSDGRSRWLAGDADGVSVWLQTPLWMRAPGGGRPRRPPGSTRRSTWPTWPGRRRRRLSRPTDRNGRSKPRQRSLSRRCRRPAPQGTRETRIDPPESAQIAVREWSQNIPRGQYHTVQTDRVHTIHAEGIRQLQTEGIHQVQAPVSRCRSLWLWETAARPTGRQLVRLAPGARSGPVRPAARDGRSSVRPARRRVRRTATGRSCSPPSAASPTTTRAPPTRPRRAGRRCGSC